MRKSKKESLSFFSLLFLLLCSLLAGLMGGFFASQFKEQLIEQIPFLQNLQTKQETLNTEKKIILKEEKVFIEESSIITAVKEVSPAVVSIVITKDLPMFRNRPFFFDFDQFFNDPFSDNFFNIPQQNNQPSQTQKRKVGGGTGFIFDSSGLVLTNRHVVADKSADFTVILSDGKEFSAKVLDQDLVNDIAVLKIKNSQDQENTELNINDTESNTEENKNENQEILKEFPTVFLGNSDKIEVGQKVIAVGNALAEFENTVTSGVISAKGRSITAGASYGNRLEKLSGLIQTDAAINPGNSGGPLVNLSGEVIGINTAIASGANGIGFAIPINDAKSIIESIKKHGKIIRPFLGVRFLMLDQAKAKKLDIPVKNGALLVGNDLKGEFAVVPASPAEKAGLKSKDIIIEIDGQKLDQNNDLLMIIARKNIGDEIELKVWRSGKEIKLKVTLEESPW